jgi:hypothetical protein
MEGERRKRDRESPPPPIHTKGHLVNLNFEDQRIVSAFKPPPPHTHTHTHHTHTHTTGKSLLDKTKNLTKPKT